MYRRRSNTCRRDCKTAGLGLQNNVLTRHADRHSRAPNQPPALGQGDNPAIGASCLIADELCFGVAYQCLKEPSRLVFQTLSRGDWALVQPKRPQPTHHRSVQEPGGGAFKPVPAEPWVHRLRSGLVAPTTEAGLRTRQQGSDHGELQASSHHRQPHAVNAGGPRAGPLASVGAARQTPSPGRYTSTFGAACGCRPSAATTLSTVASSGCPVPEST